MHCFPGMHRATRHVLDRTDRPGEVRNNRYGLKTTTSYALTAQNKPCSGVGKDAKYTILIESPNGTYKRNIMPKEEIQTVAANKPEDNQYTNTQDSGYDLFVSNSRGKQAH